MIVDGDEITHVEAEQDFGRIGNQAGPPESPVVLGDFKTDPEAELERPTQISLTDTESGEIDVVNLPASYSFRSLARGPEGEALVLGTGGTLRVIDEESGETAAEVPVTEEWEEPAEWQTPMPNITVSDELAYVTDPETQTMHIVDLAKAEDGAEALVDSVELAQVPNEVAVASGAAALEGGTDDGHKHSETGEDGR